MNIKQISSNYSITTHTLRYYEKIGLLFPSYLENGYRDYSYEDIQRLNIIRDLRTFDIPLSEIKKYIDQKNKDITKEILVFQVNEAKKKIRELENRVFLLEERINLLNDVENKELFCVKNKFYPNRKIIVSKNKSIPGKNLYLELKKLHKQFELELHSSNQNIFGTILTQTAEGFAHQVFYCIDSDQDSKNAILLPAGHYASIYYNGDYTNRDHALTILKQYIQDHSINTLGLFHEFYMLDFHETNNQNEYVTKIEVKISQ
ncbi:MerR family transcriptional regulator [Enterococcus sp. CR-Ec1]|uniref:MerR family transcriptional regulator n=1 Tax=Enterococcus sp. CR-Ec1 TaxID=2057791 RepID=UPI000C793A21|nr:MerR family transcriptional regulator [Enterococcus sp. CR-Ec1]AUJ87421.1 transcriptional regulator [Enterococcus sp. CR-Ec1]